MKRNSTKFLLDNGFGILDLIKKKEIKSLLAILVKKINSDLFKESHKFTNQNISNFHLFKLSEKSNFNIMNSSNRFINLDNDFLSSITNNREIKKISATLWGHSDLKCVWVGSPKKREIEIDKAGYRIFLPSKNKKNKIIGHPHIDAYSADINSFFTLWIPLVGFTEKYTMMLFPKTHIIDHKKNNFKNKKKYISRILNSSYTKKFKYIRPRLRKGQSIIHLPNTIHSGGVNFGSQTRISLEIRIFNKKTFNKKKSFNLKLYS